MYYGNNLYNYGIFLLYLLTFLLTNSKLNE
jgi:hypothetical protein